MKKKKSTDHPPADFKNTPFRDLKIHIPLIAGKESTSIPTRNRKEGKEEDAQELFLQAVEGVRKIQSDSISDLILITKKPLDYKDTMVQRDDQLFFQAMNTIGASIKDVRELEEEEINYERRSASSRMKQLKRGTIRVSSELDLHGYLQDEALRRLEQFILDSHSAGQQAVLVITGKGINSPEGPVLQGAVASWLREHGKGMVTEFSPAPREKGGSGAFVVFLKKK